MSEQQQAAQAVAQWVPVIHYLGDVEGAVANAPTIGAIDQDQVQDAVDAVRAARLAVSALVGEYIAASGLADSNPSPAQQQAVVQQWTQRNPISASRPGDQLGQQSGLRPEAQASHFGGWQS